MAHDCMLLYEEGEVKHINDVWPYSKHLQLGGLYACICACIKRYPTTWSNLNLWRQTFVAGMGGWDHWYAQLHLLHRIQSSMQRLHGLSHLEILFQKAQSHISMMLFVACRRLTWVKLSMSWIARGKYWSWTTKRWIIDWAVEEFPKDSAQTIVCCLQDIISSNTGYHPKVWVRWSRPQNAWASVRDRPLNCVEKKGKRIS